MDRENSVLLTRCTRWVFSNKLASSQQSGHSIYTPGQTAKQLKGQNWKISYGDGSSASGTVFSDKVAVGGTTVEAQAVELATTISDEFVQSSGDGLLGLAFSSINTVTPTSQKTFFDNALASLDAPLFAVDLKKGQPGTYDFGFIVSRFRSLTSLFCNMSRIRFERSNAESENVSRTRANTSVRSHTHR